MNLLDIFALGVIALSAAMAMMRGLTAELFWLGGVIAGFVLAAHFHQEAAAVLIQWTGPVAAAFLGFAGIFVASVAAGSLAGHWSRRLLKALRLSWVDRGFGAAFGLLRGALIAMVAFLALTAFPVRRELVSSSSLAPYFLTAARAAVLLAPRDLERSFDDGYRRLYGLWLRREVESEEGG